MTRVLLPGRHRGRGGDGLAQDPKGQGSSKGRFQCGITVEFQICKGRSLEVQKGTATQSASITGSSESGAVQAVDRGSVPPSSGHVYDESEESSEHHEER